ncbi:T7SS effector LXG polymorphic toxin [Bacillus sp. SJS]|uniref:T7SS effector LXG polymorphic toxin n=1 Tax=Bacillus sp. SJS TaxID=1423321 RepID=UPI00068B69D2|nr:T7SS effector LXG polymorphic toxin [Bacillus sp. SJS]KZZ84993.1 hypothetical protein AS29_008040 [Bacillus sp. SJS]
MGKVYDSSKLFTAIDARISQYNTLNGKLNSLEKKFQALVDNAEFQGTGAENIKSFYQAQIDLVGDWKKLIEHLLAFYQAVPGYAGDANLSDDSRVVLPFLEEQLETGSTNSQSLVDAQHSELKAILDSIQDIISLTPFSKESFETNTKKADKKRTETAEALNNLDEGMLIGRYMDSMDAQSAVQLAYIAIMEATSKGGTIQPINFNVQAYQANAIQDVRKSVSEKVKTFKDQESKAKEIREEIAAEKARIEAEKNKEWYEKAWDGVKTFTGEFSGYYDYKRATEGVDPVTGKKLSTSERIAAGSMAAAGFIPVVGWAGRAVKGGSAIYKTAKGINGINHALNAYQGTKAMDMLYKTEKGIYGLYTFNSGREYVFGTDLLGNKLTDEQRNQALINGLTMGVLGGGTKYYDKLKAANAPYTLTRRPIESAVPKRISEADRAKLDKWKFAPNEDKYMKNKETYDNPQYYNQEDGNIQWPPNNGFDGEPAEMTLKQGKLLDRYGAPNGGFFSPEGIPYEQRALALHSDEADYYVYKVLEDFDVTGGKIAPWFDRPGGGTQYLKYHEDGRTYSMEELIREELIEEVSMKKGGTQ